MDLTFLGLALYLVLMFVVGFLTWGANKTKEDFIIGGRRLGAWVIALSERTAAESSWLLLGLSGALFALGIAELWTVFGCVTGIIVSWFVIARPLRIASEELGAITLPEFFSRRAGSHGSTVRVVSMLIIVFFFTFYVSAQFIGAGKVLDTTFGIAPEWGIAAGAAVIVLYTLMGGFLAVCFTDVVQAVLMITTLVLLPVLGFVLVAQHGIDLGAVLEATGDTGSWVAGREGWAAAAWVIGGLSWGLGYMGQPHLVTKFMAIRSPEQVRAGRNIAIVWTLLAYGGAALVGLVGIGLTAKGVVDIRTMVPGDQLPARAAEMSVDALRGLADREQILPVLTNFIFPAWLAGILISGAVAAMMSTADSQLLVTTSTVVEDFWSKALGRELSPRAMVLMSRLVTAGVGLGALLLAYATREQPDFIYRVVSYAWAGLGASFGPALLAALHWRRTNGLGIVAGMVTGAVSTVLWQEIPGLDDFLSVRLVSFVLATIAVVIGTLVGEERRGA